MWGKKVRNEDMGDLISKEAMLRHFSDWQMELSEVGNEREYNLLDMIIRGVESEPIVFDLESAIVKIEKKRDLCHAEMKKEEEETGFYSEHIFEEYYNQCRAYNDCLEILKSAVNATSRKIGG